MRLCRLRHDGIEQIGLYDEERIVLVAEAIETYRNKTGTTGLVPAGDDLLPWLPPDGEAYPVISRLVDWIANHPDELPPEAVVETATAQLLVPIPRPNKLFLLAGNYAAHIEEGGDRAAERADTFPYVFMKPPTTTLTNPGDAVVIPSNSPDTIDWELELAVVIGRKAKRVSESEALDYVAGYTVINDISNRRFRPNPGRKERARDKFFDWMHGKWFDSFCPCGPCIATTDSIADPQSLAMQLTLNGEVRQDASTALQVFPVAAVVEFISNICTLEPGDIISTGTPAGVGNTTDTFLKAGDELRASIEKIGSLVSPITNEAG